LRRVRGSRFGQKKNGGRTRRGRAASEGGKEDGRKGGGEPTDCSVGEENGRDEKREGGREVRTRSRTRERILLTVREERAPARVGGPANITPVLYF